MSSRVWLALAIVVGAATPALADSTAECDYFEITASTGKEPAIDGELKPLAKKLSLVSAWNVFHKLSSGHVTLHQLKADALKLQQGTASFLLRDRTDKRLELTIELNDPDGKRWLDTKLNSNPGDWNVWGNVNHVKDVNHNGHIVALSCK
jgi:hypothetical protein